MSNDPRPLCGQPKRDGKPCGAWADTCRHHGAVTAEVGRTTGGYGNPRPVDERLAAAQQLAEGKSGKEAGKLTGVPESTIRNWRQEPEFAALVRRLNDELVTTAVYALGNVSRKAVATLDAGMDGNAKPVQIRSADIVLSRLVPLRELEQMRARLEELEAKLTGKDESSW